MSFKQIIPPKFAVHLAIILVLLPAQTFPGQSASAPQNADQNQHFEQFISRQHFPSNRPNATALPVNSPSKFGEQPSFRANCTVPICEGPLAPIFCSGPLISSAWYFGVQQQCPGSRLLNEPEQIVANFQRIIRDNVVRRGDFLGFCEENFQNADYLQPANLTDWFPNPPNFARIYDPKMKKFAIALHQIWPSLTREFLAQVHQNQDRYPVLSVPNRFVVPGGFFKVYFYWDTYWILKGLYFSNLTETARGMLDNFAHVLHFHGFIPNSGNVQLSRRSQPPLFTQMIADYFEHTGNKTFLREFLPHVENELEWWRRNRSIAVEMDGQKHGMFQYKSVTDCPRPENFLEDYQLGTQTADPQYFWSSTASACESGLDFSSRWYRWGSHGKKELSRKLIATNAVLPVDLNIFMAMNYWTMAKLWGKVLGDGKKEAKYSKMAKALTNSIDRIFYDESEGAWFDFDLDQRLRRTKFYPSNIYALLLEGNNGTEKCQKVVEYLRGSGALEFKGGIPSSLEKNSFEQWDFPNGWAPQQHLFVISILRCGENEEARKIGRQIADAFLTTAYNGLFNASRGKPAQMWEKYDVRYENGQSGGGGEYPPQSGFGWSNGVVFEFIRMFYTNRGDNPVGDGSAQTQIFAMQSMIGLLKMLNHLTTN